MSKIKITVKEVNKPSDNALNNLHKVIHSIVTTQIDNSKSKAS